MVAVIVVVGSTCKKKKKLNISIVQNIKKKNVPGTSRRDASRVPWPAVANAMLLILLLPPLPLLLVLMMVVVVVWNLWALMVFVVVSK